MGYLNNWSAIFTNHPFTDTTLFSKAGIVSQPSCLLFCQNVMQRHDSGGNLSCVKKSVLAINLSSNFPPNPNMFHCVQNNQRYRKYKQLCSISGDHQVHLVSANVHYNYFWIFSNQIGHVIYIFTWAKSYTVLILDHKQTCRGLNLIHESKDSEIDLLYQTCCFVSSGSVASYF